MQQLPALGMGTSRLPHYFSKKHALRDMEYMYDEGILYFDTSPIYGYGWSEKILGQFIQGKRSKLIITTKAGLEPSQILSRLSFQTQYVLRKTAKTLKSITRKNNTTGIPLGVERPKLEAAKLMSSLDKSLRRLKTDYVDFLLLHESTLEEANSPEAVSFFEKSITAGKIRFAGIGSSLDKLSHGKSLHPIYSLVQKPLTLDHQQDQLNDYRIYNVHGLREMVNALKKTSKTSSLYEGILQQTGLDVTHEDSALMIAFAIAAEKAKYGIVLIASSKQEHLQHNIEAWRKRYDLHIAIDHLLGTTKLNRLSE